MSYEIFLQRIRILNNENCTSEMFQGKEVNMVSYNLLWEMNGFLYAQFKQSFEDDYVVSISSNS